MKKIFAILLTLVMVISMFAGCGGNPEHDHAPTTVPTEVITDPTGTVTDPVVDETEAPVETTVPNEIKETEAPKEAETEAPSEAPTEPETTECKHDYKSTVVAPTCTANGYTLHKCKNCNYEYKNSETTAKGHAWSEWKITKEPTASELGQEAHTCNNCGKTETRDIDQRHKHSYNSKVTKVATCTEEGIKTFTCTCGASYTEAIAKTGHSWGNWVVTKEPTTSAEGQETRTCSACGKTENRAVDKLPADNGGSDDDTGNQGYYWFGNQKIYWNCASQGHKTMGEPEVIQRATCVHDKIVKYTCVVVGCGATWEENRGGAGSVSHVMSAADQARVTCGDYFYHIKCNCGLGVSGNTRDEALAKHNAHIAENLYDGYCGIMREWDGHHHNFPSSTFNCAVCNKAIPFDESYVVCAHD